MATARKNLSFVSSVEIVELESVESMTEMKVMLMHVVLEEQLDFEMSLMACWTRDNLSIHLASSFGLEKYLFAHALMLMAEANKKLETRLDTLV